MAKSTLITAAILAASLTALIDSVRSSARASVRGDPRDVLSEDERVDIVRPLVRIHAFQIRHMPHRVILGENAVKPLGKYFGSMLQ